jgi:putative endopeptidase
MLTFACFYRQSNQLQIQNCVMMKKLLYASGIFTLVAIVYACTPKTTQQAQQNPTTNGNNIVTPAGKRKFIDPINMNLSVRPQDDFYEYANGAWMKTAVIPASESRWGSFNELAEFNQKALKDICEEVAASKNEKGSIRQKVGDFYASGMDSVAIEKAGISPLKPYLDRINNIKNYTGLLDEIAAQYAEGRGNIWRLGARQDAKNSTNVVVHLAQGGTRMPDRDYYLKDDERFKKVRIAYETHIYNTFRLLGETEMKAKQAVTDIMTIEKAFALAQQSRVERRDPDKTYNKVTVADLEKICPQMNWEPFFKKTGAVSSYMVIDNPKFFQEVNNLLKNGQLDDWKTYLRWNLIKGAMSYLSTPFVNENFKWSQIISGQKEMQPRWKRVSQVTDGILGEALGEIYVNKYFKPESKQRMLELVGNLVKTYEKRIKGLDWMSDETKGKALQKLSTFIKKIGYPDKFQDYTPLSIDRSKSYLDNLIAATKFGYNDMIKEIGKPVDKTKWGMSPPTVNAYYNPAINEIVFPAGILQFPFFDNNADDAVNYGGIGAVIGHEISHGFDDQGRKFDLEGNLKDWWTADDAKKFEAKANIVVEQYSNYVVLDTVHVNGKLTLGENIGDLGGIAVAYDAFKTYSPQAKSPDKMDGFTPDQRFFLSWAQVWRSTQRPEALANQVQTDPHSPGKFRCNGPLSNMVEFYNVFGVKEGDKMWRPEAVRAKIW